MREFSFGCTPILLCTFSLLIVIIFVSERDNFYFLIFRIFLIIKAFLFLWVVGFDLDDLNFTDVVLILRFFCGHFLRNTNFNFFTIISTLEGLNIECDGLELGYEILFISIMRWVKNAVLVLYHIFVCNYKL